MNSAYRKLLHRYKDALAAAVLFVIMAYVVYASRDIKTLIDASVDAKFFPTVIGIVGMLLSAINLIAGIRRGRAEQAPDGSDGAAADPARRTYAVRMLLNILLLFAYLVCIEALGFVPSSFLYVVAQVYLLSDGARPRPVTVILLALIVSLASYLFFRNIFNLMLPRGIMPF